MPVRKYKKKQLLESLNILGKANDSLRDCRLSDIDEITDVLSQCQELAIAIGTDLEEREEDSSVVIAMLEEYCENLYQLSVSPLNPTLRNKLTKKIRSQLSRIECEIRNVLPDDRKEVVFLPYKASMWDALESVWMAAKEDGSCDVYVIPIPYYKKNPDGSFGAMCYEGEDYPDYVPVISWKEYDIQERHPDMIFIHNPYDNWNSVTSVHPQFYSEKLRNYTDRLVYIPYFILSEISPEDQSKIDRIKQFCFLPGTIYADRVIVQSEAMRQIYINEFIKAAKAAGITADKTMLEQKFLGLGSPKIDKVLDMAEEDVVLPDAWQARIVRPDGSRKKIILYNTTIASLLKHNEKMLEKITDVLATFKEIQDDIVLLWRPHPLFRSTIESMRMQMLETHDLIVKTYLEEGWGIYDETPDLNRAIAISDAYYGDFSSVVQLYEETGKPIMIQDIMSVQE